MCGAGPLDKWKNISRDRTYVAEDMAPCVRTLGLQAWRPKSESQHSHKKPGMAANEIVCPHQAPTGAPTGAPTVPVSQTSDQKPEGGRPGSLEGNDQEVAHTLLVT